MSELHSLLLLLLSLQSFIDLGLLDDPAPEFLSRTFVHHASTYNGTSFSDFIIPGDVNK
jgi:hypothetical protein